MQTYCKSQPRTAPDENVACFRMDAAAVGAIDFGKDTATVAGATFATGAPASGSDGADTTGIAGAAADGAVQA